VLSLTSREKRRGGEERRGEEEKETMGVGKDPSFQKRQ
jgi:hypothetical protein